MTTQEALIGTWRIKSAVSEDLATGQKSDFFGPHPSGYISYGPDSRMQALLVKDGRKAPAGLVATDAERIELYNGLIAYAGSYSVEGDTVSHHVDVSFNQAWTGTIQLRQFKIDGDKLNITTPPIFRPDNGQEQTFEFVWTKVG
jgi:hypothetical protein